MIFTPSPDRAKTGDTGACRPTNNPSTKGEIPESTWIRSHRADWTARLGAFLQRVIADSFGPECAYGWLAEPAVAAAIMSTNSARDGGNVRAHEPSGEADDLNE